MKKIIIFFVLLPALQQMIAQSTNAFQLLSFQSLFTKENSTTAIPLLTEPAVPVTSIYSFAPQSAVIGQTITITGENFINISAVLIGGEEVASFSVIDANTITAVIGDENACGNVSVTSRYNTATKSGFIMGAIWKGRSFGGWDNPLNWQPAAVPALGAAIEINCDISDDVDLFTLDADRTIGTLNFNNKGKKVVLGNYTLTVNEIIGADLNNYIKTDGTGKLKMNIPNGTSKKFEVGNVNYNPVTITNQSGATDDFEVNILAAVFENGYNGAIILNKHVSPAWNINKLNGNGGSGVSFEFGWSKSSLPGAVGSLALYHYNGTMWEKQIGSTVYALGENSTLTYSGYTGSFSPFAIVEDIFTLPLSWLSFTAQKNKEEVLLKWTTTSEVNTKDFIVQHSINGTSWNTLGNVKAAGLSNATNQYSFTHYTPELGNNYYRLIQRDEDGKSSYSSTVTVNQEQASPSFKVYPNPVTNGKLNIQLQASTTVNIYNNTGVLVLQKQLPAGNQKIDVSKLSKGNYKVQAGDATVQIFIQ